MVGQVFSLEKWKPDSLQVLPQVPLGPFNLIHSFPQAFIGAPTVYAGGIGQCRQLDLLMSP